MKCKIGTRSSKLAMWQANSIKSLLEDHGLEPEIVEIESFGDRVQDLPIHKLGDKGVFTKALDEALLSGACDIAVHSLKDVPTIIPEGLVLSCVPFRENPKDVLVGNPDTDLYDSSNIIATGSIRRRAFWLNMHPEAQTVDLRGNVPTRLQKVHDSDWKGAVFAYAGLKRLGLTDHVTDDLSWMIPAPAQGAVGIVSRSNSNVNEALQVVEDAEVRMCVDTERAFLNTLEAGCSSPVGALAVVTEDRMIRFKGAVLSTDGKQRIDITDTLPIEEYEINWGVRLALSAIEQGARELMALGE